MLIRPTPLSSSTATVSASLPDCQQESEQRTSCGSGINSRLQPVLSIFSSAPLILMAMHICLGFTADSVLYISKVSWCYVCARC